MMRIRYGLCATLLNEGHEEYSEIYLYEKRC